MANSARSVMVLWNPEDVLRNLFRNGDPDSDEFSDFTDFAVLKVPGQAAEGGVVRILCHLINRRYRLVMRNAAATAALLNHFLVPGLRLHAAEQSVSYTTDDYSATGHRRALQVRLTFAGPEVRGYFEGKFAGGVCANGRLVDRGIVALARPSRDFPLSNHPLNGIIAHLTRQCGRNVDDARIVLVTSSPPFNDTPTYAPKNVVDLAANSFFTSADFRPDTKNIPHTRNNWICLDFQERRVVVAHYTIGTSSLSTCGNANPSSWIVEVSVDGKNWVEIDKRENTNDLNASNVMATFKAAATAEGRFVRFVNVGKNHCGSDRLFISTFEIFGTLIE
jgi:hypothetical protein